MTRKSTQTVQEPQTAETVQEAQTTQEPQEGQTTPDPQEVLAALPEEVRAQLEAAGLEIRRKGQRGPRKERMTGKQAAFIRALQDSGEEQDVAGLCLSAGATATSHGFVFRMLEHGYLRLEVTDKAREMLPDAGGEDESTES